MDEAKKEELLIRIDERTTTLVDKVELLNKKVDEQLEKIAERQEDQNDGIEAALLLATSNQTSIKWVKGILGTIGTIILAMVGFFLQHLPRG